MRSVTHKTTRLPFLLLATLSLNTTWAALVGHERCTDCHLTAAPTPEHNELTHSIETLCTGCHENGGNSDHAVGVPPGVEGTGGLPLVAGKIACITCHDMHAGTRMLLRINTEALCLACHPNH